MQHIEAFLNISGDSRPWWPWHRGIAARICANTMVMAFQSEFNGLETGYNEGGQLGNGIFMGFSMGFSWDFHGIQWWPNRIINHGCEICHGGVQFLAGKIIELNGVVSSHVTPGCFLRNVDDQIVGFLCQSDTRSLIYHDLSFVYGIYVYRRYLSTSRFIWNEEVFDDVFQRVPWIW